jgi:hypothetical protein
MKKQMLAIAAYALCALVLLISCNESDVSTPAVDPTGDW